MPSQQQPTPPHRRRSLLASVASPSPSSSAPPAPTPSSNATSSNPTAQKDRPPRRVSVDNQENEPMLDNLVEVEMMGHCGSPPLPSDNAVTSPKLRPLWTEPWQKQAMDELMYQSNRLLQSTSCALYAGSTFVGEQRSGRSSYDVRVVIQASIPFQ